MKLAKQFRKHAAQALVSNFSGYPTNAYTSIAGVPYILLLCCWITNVNSKLLYFG